MNDVLKVPVGGTESLLVEAIGSLDLLPADWSRIGRIGDKELAMIFDITQRHLRRLRNQQGLITPIRGSNSVRIACYSAEEIARFAAHRFRQGHGYVRSFAELYGGVTLIEAVRLAVENAAKRQDPNQRWRSRHDLHLELLAHGSSSPLAKELGLTQFEIELEVLAARKTLAVLLGSSATKRNLAASWQAGLVALAVQSSQCSQGEEPAPNV